MLPDLILVVCTGNVCRSPYVEFTLRDALADWVRIGSAGTEALVGEPVDPGADELLAAGGIDADGFAARQVTADLVRESTLILTATRSQRTQVVRMETSGLRKTFALIDFSDIVAQLDFAQLQPSFMDPPDLSPLGLLVSGAARHLGRITPRSADKADIVDPFGQGNRAFKQMQQQIDDALPPVVTAVTHLYSGRAHTRAS
ncbi:hypothetical protein [Flexivirga alba]|uniref:Phosphotyrosine protein phosphatase I domain-containing protein n=1 Tax=Flexivirga alba TaxID=702742 RepID=A0ABW2AGP0_9MICO